MGIAEQRILNQSFMKTLSLFLALGLCSYSSFAGTKDVKAKPMGCVQVKLSCGQGAACGKTAKEIAQTAAEMEKVYCGC